MKSIVVKVIEVEQPIGVFYICKIPANIFVLMAKADMRSIGELKDYYFGIQRKLDPARIIEVRDYVKTHDSSFPNSIIVNLNSDHIINFNNDEIEVKVTPETFTIIDGQHRVAGFTEDSTIKFDLIVTIFIDLEKELQARLFATINSEQKKVSSSLSIDLEHYSNLRTPRKVAHNLAIAFNVDKDSPWFNKIKMLGYKDELSSQGIITQSTFVKPIIEAIYPDTNYNSIREELNSKLQQNQPQILNVNMFDNDKYFLWYFYATDQEKAMYKVLFNYFSSFKQNLSEQWGNSKYLLTKTIGYYAIMRLLRDLTLIGLREKNLSLEFFNKYISKLSSIKYTLTSDKYGTSGEQAVWAMYNDFKSTLQL